AVADLIPQLQHRLSWRDTASQLAWLAGGLAIVVAAIGTLHGH
ncbi:MAG TPA: ZIP family metal transporter, partial [Albitalea sp.]|nr:ZIP family metal transporter [Albitalea sp.]